MKKIIYFLIVFGLTHGIALCHGVAVKDAGTGKYFLLKTSTQAVTVYDQVATTVTTQVFKNQTTAATVVKYAFPLHEEASATCLRWKANNIWHTAIFTPEPQDTTFPGGGTPNQNLKDYLGKTPLYFEVPDTIPPDSTLTVELSYVELLPYSFGTVQYDYPNDYHLIQSAVLDKQSIHFVLESQRHIDSISFTGGTGPVITNTGSHAEITYAGYEIPATQNYKIKYSLAASTMGLYGYSTYLPDSLMVCDSLGNGYFTFIVEPSPDTTQVLQKIFSLVIDYSGSMMSGTKIQQAKDAATFIVNHLNTGDLFNIIAFNEATLSFMPDHVPYNATNKQLALNFISSLSAGGSTDIAGALHTTIEDYAGNDTTVANIVIFLTDGQPTTGLLGTDEILQSIHDDLTFYEVQYLMINTFGIGTDVNQSLLSQIASQNNGLCQFLMNDELEEAITKFYLMICNPVLLNIHMAFDPPIVSEVYPDPSPNLYIGQQLILAGRYDSITYEPLTVSLTGTAFGQTHTYTYNFMLADSMIADYMFTTKIWAIKKINHLYIEYFTYPSGSAQADSIKDLIIGISICYNVSSPFTQLGTPPPVGVEETGSNVDQVEQLTAYPNPFSDEVTFGINIKDAVCGQLKIVIYDMYGAIVQIIYLDCDKPGLHQVKWDGRNSNGDKVDAGMYFYQVNIGGKIIKGKLIKNGTQVQ
ncbi:MAG: VWA domain-containing protein [Bacteroidota bacterium]